jgi:hypothetical protein
MFFEQSEPDIQNKLQYSLEYHQHQRKILAFLRSNLPEISNKLIKGAKSSLSDFEEDDLTGEINNLLNDKSRESSGYLFRFEAKSGPDILMFASPYEPFSMPLFVIEAKRLPPTRSKDYVLTGIRRFKIEEHGKHHDIAAMLGYVQDKNFNHWYDEINLWIEDLIADTAQKPRWEQQDKLNKVGVASYGEYTSTHSRVKMGPITLHHFWLDFCNN